MLRFRRSGALLVALLVACAPGGRESDVREPDAALDDAAAPDGAVTDSTPDPDTPVSWPPRGGRLVALDDGTEAELIVDDTGMMFVYLFDRERRTLPTAGRQVTVRVTTPDGSARDMRLSGMGRGASAHHMNPMDEAMLAHVREQGGYTARVTVQSGAERAVGETAVQGVATGGKGM